MLSLTFGPPKATTMASIINRKFSTISRDLELVAISTVTHRGYTIPNSEHFLPEASAVNEATVNYTDQIGIQATPSGAMYSGSSIMRAALPAKMGPIWNLWLDWTLTNNAAVGAQTAQVYTYTPIDTTTGVLSGGGAITGDVVWGLPDYHLWTKPLPVATTAAAVAAAIRALDVNIVTSLTGGGGPLSTPAAITLTCDIHDRDIKIEARAVGCSSFASKEVIIRNAITTPFVLGGACHLAPTPLQVEYVSLLINSDVKSKISGSKLWMDVLFHHNEHKLDNIMRRCGFNLDTDEPTLVVEGGSASSTTCHLPLHPFIGNWKQMFPGRFPNAKFEIEVKFKTNSSIFCSNALSGSATATTATVNNLMVGQMTLWSTYSRLSDKDLKEVQAMSLTRPITIRHIWQNTGGMQGTAGAVTATTKYQAKINETADVIAAEFALEPNGVATADFFIHPIGLSSIELYDASNNSILGYTSINNSQMQDEIIPYAFGSQDARVNDFFRLYAWVPTTDIDGARDHGAVKGFYALQGNETFWYTVDTLPTTPLTAVGVSFLPVMHTDQVRALTFHPDGKCVQE